MKKIRVYIGTLYVGENEIEECKESVKNQTFSNITHEIFSYLPNKEAHDTLYSKFMELQNEYDYFIKLDADMVFIRDTIVDELVEIFESHENLDHAVFSVHDWYSDSDIMGLSIFSNRVKWIISNEQLFVDHSPNIKGERIIFNSNPAPVAYHGHNPSLEEAYMFGYHRALKIVQRNKIIKNTNQAKFQLNLIQKSFECIKNNYELKRIAVILGAEKALKSSESKLENKIGVYDENELDTLKYDKIFNNFKYYWDRESYGFKLRYFKYVVIYEFVFYIPKYFYSTLKTNIKRILK